MTSRSDSQPTKFHQRVMHRLCNLAEAGTVLLLAVGVSRFFASPLVLELATHFQFQYLIAAILALATLVGLKRWRWVVPAGLNVILFGSAVMPLYFGGRDGVAGPETTTLRILQANVMTSNTNHQGLMRIIEAENPDLIVLQEVNDAWMQALDGLRSTWPHVVADPRSDNFGIALFSRVPLTDAEVIFVGDAGVPSVSTGIDIDGRSVRLVATHPIPPVGGAGFRRRNTQLAAVAGLLADERRPLIIVGDLNVSPWSPYYHDLTAALALTNVRNGFGVRATWPSGLPALMRIPIDQILVSGDFTVTACRVGQPYGSDHLPLIADIQLVDR